MKEPPSPRLARNRRPQAGPGLSVLLPRARRRLTVCGEGGLGPAVPPPPLLFLAFPSAPAGAGCPPPGGSPPGPGCQGKGLGFSSQGPDVGDPALI